MIWKISQNVISACSPRRRTREPPSPLCPLSPYLVLTHPHPPFLIKSRLDFNHGWTEKEGQGKGRWSLPATLSRCVWCTIFGKYSSSTCPWLPDSSWTSKRYPSFTTQLSSSNFRRDK